MHTLAMVAVLALLPPCEGRLVEGSAPLVKANVAGSIGLGSPLPRPPGERATRRRQILFVSTWMQAAVIASANGLNLSSDELKNWIEEALGEDAHLETFDEQRAADAIEFLRKNVAAVSPPFGRIFLRYQRR